MFSAASGKFLYQHSDGWPIGMPGRGVTVKSEIYAKGTRTIILI